MVRLAGWRSHKNETESSLAKNNVPRRVPVQWYFGQIIRHWGSVCCFKWLTKKFKIQHALDLEGASFGLELLHNHLHDLLRVDSWVVLNQYHLRCLYSYLAHLSGRPYLFNRLRQNLDCWTTFHSDVDPLLFTSLRFWAKEIQKRSTGEHKCVC